MMWNYRIIGIEDEPDYFSIHEVFYDENGNIQGWTADPIDFGGESPGEVIAALLMAAKDITNMPVLWEIDGKLVEKQ